MYGCLVLGLLDKLMEAMKQLDDASNYCASMYVECKLPPSGSEISDASNVYLYIKEAQENTEKAIKLLKQI